MLETVAKFFTGKCSEQSISAVFCDPLIASFQPEGVEAQMRRVFSATIGLLSESHGIVPHYLQSPANHSFYNLITLLNSRKGSGTPNCF
jgi:hypothetical protein